MKDTDFADGIYWILDAINYRLGGNYDHSTGIDYRNGVFETRSFWAHCDSCDCGADDREAEVDEQVHALMERHGPEPMITDPGWTEWYRLYQMEYGNVTQGEDIGHTKDCIAVQPQFRHYASGLEVEWYKRVGRSTESNISMKTLDWYKIVVECIESVRDDPDPKEGE